MRRRAGSRLRTRHSGAGGPRRPWAVCEPALDVHAASNQPVAASRILQQSSRSTTGSVSDQRSRFPSPISAPDSGRAPAPSPSPATPSRSTEASCKTMNIAAPDAAQHRDGPHAAGSNWLPKASAGVRGNSASAAEKHDFHSSKARHMTPRTSSGVASPKIDMTSPRRCGSPAVEEALAWKASPPSERPFGRGTRNPSSQIFACSSAYANAIDFAEGDVSRDGSVDTATDAVAVGCTTGPRATRCSQANGAMPIATARGTTVVRNAYMVVISSPRERLER